MSDKLDGIIEFLRGAERMNVVARSAYTSLGEAESVAEHSWRLCLMALVLRDELPEVDIGRLLQICVIHDLGEAIGGDIPAPEQARRTEAGSGGKGEAERNDLLTLLAPLPASRRAEILQLWDEYETASTAEARVAKALDKLETILQHNQGSNPPDFDYRFNLAYGRTFTSAPPVVAELRKILDAQTEELARRCDERTLPIA
jgi:putative hydrolases of HD superfamily